MDVNYELYKVFYYVAVSLSFSEASKQLFISQSAVSQSIKVLEKKLGISLFIRSTKKVQLTPEGETLLRHIEPAVNLIQRGEAQIMESSTLGGGQLRIGASDTICRYYLVSYLQKFHKSYPNVHIKVTNQTSTRCVDLLESGQVDLIVTNFPNSRLPSRMTTIPIYEFQDVFIANRDYFSQLTGRKIHLKELLEHPILMLDRKSTTSEFLHNLFQQHQLDLVPEIELGSNDLLIDLANIGLGIAFVPDYCIKNSQNLFQVQIAEDLPTRQLVIAHNAHLPIPQAAKEFLLQFSQATLK
ncbi:LysR family transcriptional regulator [Novisyntrophococcus fermenticellae]|uniref:LysR family transcriptional regulator n=1 Tax=Novisyntrophococcus fermenticellae TaxID=2068655 RepID=UPI001E60A48C|nr:LysR family transcriptional regulator [Novisyntrophococcus fermenticellae]